MIELIEYKYHQYPKYQAEGFAAKFAFPFAKEVCKGKGYDIGCMKKEWALEGAIPIDVSFEDTYDAHNLPEMNVDYIFSSHCLEHIHDWVGALNYWTKTLKMGGVLFLYLPDFSQVYWRPWNNRKHVTVLSADLIEAYMLDNGYINIFKSGVDLNNSFMIMGQKNKL